MSKVTINLETLVGIADAVRAKKGTAEQIPVANLASEIEGIAGTQQGISATTRASGVVLVTPVSYATATVVLPIISATSSATGTIE